MKQLLLFSVLCVLCIVVKSNKHVDHVVCIRDYKKIGCYESLDRLLPNLLITDRDLKSEYSQGLLINWRNFSASTHSLACRCSEEAQKKLYKFFGIRYYGECYGGNDISALHEEIAKKKKKNVKSACINNFFQDCQNDVDGECAGRANGEYIYELVKKDSTTVDGGFGEWSEFGRCSTSCGTGVIARERQCNSPQPSGENAKDCSELGQYTETKVCVMEKCAEISLWNSWSYCNVTCGGGIQTRQRSCEGVGRCNGPLNESRECNTEKCPVNGEYSEWSEWSPCSVSCGGGEENRKRTCDNPPPSNGGQDCDGADVESRQCNTKSCTGPCNFMPGDGTGGSEMNIGTKSTVAECILECEKKRLTTHPNINGVTIPQTGAISCYCEMGMTGRNTNTNWKSCMTIPVNGGFSDWSSWGECSNSCGGGTQNRTRTCTNPVPENGGKECLGDYQETHSCNEIQCPGPCNFMPGDGTGGSEMNIGTKSTVAECILECEKKRLTTHPNINGVTIPQTGAISCYCEMGMTGRNTNTNWKSCMTIPVNGGFSDWSSWGECSNSCGGGTQNRTRTCTNPVPENGGKECLGDYQETHSCNEIQCPGPCNFMPGDGTGGSEMNIGTKSTVAECILECEKKRLTTHPNINGVTIPQTGAISCYCEMGMTGRNTNTNWKSCMTIPVNGGFSDWSSWGECSNSCGGGTQNRTRTCTNPVPENGGKECLGDYQETHSCNEIQCPGPCNFMPGDGTGGSEMNIGTKSTVAECILECEKKRLTTHPNINGVTIPQTGAISCYCEMGMTGRNTNTNWKSCMTIPVNGGFSDWSSWGECSNSCGGGTQNRTRTCTNPVPENGGKECLGDYQETHSCNEIQCPGPCNFMPGDGTGGSEMNIGTKSTVAECILECEKKRLTTHPNINGVTIPQTGAISCYCEMGMTGRNTNTNWKSCMTIPVNGGFSDWSSWGECSNSCGGGTQNRTRTCTNPVPENGGKECLGDYQETHSCNEIQCPGPCNFMPGDGTGGSEMNIGTKSTVAECILECEKKRLTTHPNINGVTIPQTGAISCYCEMGMTGRNTNTNWKSCMTIPVNGGFSDWSSWGECSNSCGGGTQNRTRTCTNPVPENGGKECLGDYQETHSCNEIQCPGPCNFMPGDGTGGSEMNIGTKSTVAECILECEKKRLTTHPNINGVTIPQTGAISCYCEMGMTGRNTNTNWKSCMTIPVNGGFSDWSSWGECSNSCGGGTQNRTRTCTNPVPENGGKECLGDYQETHSCNEIQCPGPCNFMPGDGTGGSEMNIGTKSTVAECILECEKKRLTTHPNINGVTIPQTGAISCYCEMGMTGRNTNTNWKSCMTIPVNGGFSDWSSWGECSNSCGGGTQNRTRTCTNPVPENGGKECLGDYQETHSCNEIQCPGPCNFMPGDGTGGSEMNIGTKSTVAECILECEKKRLTTHPNINGVTIPQTGAISCYCEMGMTGRNTNTNWKSCMTIPVNGGFSDWSSWGECSNSCGGGTQNRTRTCTNPVPENGGKECLGDYQETHSCNEIQCPGPCNFMPGDGTGGSEMNIGTKSTVAECILECEKKRLTTHPNINGVTIPQTGAISCYCEMGMTGRNTNTNWKSCMTIPVNGGFSDWSSWGECSNSCGGGTQNRTRTCTNPVPENGGKECLGDYQETHSCNEIQCPGPCNFMPGDGTGGSEMNIGTKSTVAECILECEKKRLTTHPNINGVTIPQTGAISCYCEMGMTGRNTNTNWKSCMTIPVNGGFSDWSSWGECSNSCGGGTQNRTRTCTNPVPENGGKECLGDYQETHSCNEIQCPGPCNFMPGDGTGGSEMNIGTKSTVAECILECEKKRLTTHPNINGVTIPQTGAISCYCEMGMTGRNTNTNWKSCMTIPVNGGFSDWSSWGECSNSCGGGTQNRTRTCTNPVPENGGKECLGDYQETHSCNEIQCPGPCNFMPGDGTGGSEMNIGTKSTVAECILECEKKRLTTHPNINGVTIPQTGAISCYCEMGMTGRNTNTNWKSCMTI